MCFNTIIRILVVKITKRIQLLYIMEITIRHKARMLLTLISLATLCSVGDGGMTFPMTVGGFNGDTVIQKMAVDSAQNMVIAGRSWDTAIVSAANTNFIMYLNSGGNQWLWTKQFGCAGSAQDVKSLAIMSDRVALITASTSLYVFDVSGYLLRQQVEPTPVITCTPACKIFFRVGLLYLFATSVSSPKMLYTAVFDGSLPAGTTISYKVWSAAAAIQFLDADNGQWQIFISVQYGTSQSAILNIDPTLSTANWFLYIQQVGLVTRLSSIYMSPFLLWDNYNHDPQRQTLYLYTEVSYNLWYTASIQVNSATDYQFQAQIYVDVGTSYWSSSKLLDFRSWDRKTSYSLLHYIRASAGTDHCLGIWKMKIWYEPTDVYVCDSQCNNCGCKTWWNQGQNVWRSNYDYWFIYPQSQNLMINSALIFDYNNWLLAGYNPEYMYPKAGGATSLIKTSFIFNPEPSLCILVDDPVFGHDQSYLAQTGGLSPLILSITPTSSSPSIASNGCSSPQNLLMPDMILYTANLQEYKSKKEPLEQIYWLTHDSTARSLTYKSITACNDLCNQAVAFDPNTPMLGGCSLTDFYQTNVSMLLHCSGVTSGLTYNISIRGTFPPQLFSNTLFVENSYELLLLDPKILNSAPAIQDQIYYIDEAPLLDTFPTIPYTHSLSGNAWSFPAISTDARLQIVNYVRYADATPKSNWITYDTNTRGSSIETQDESFDGTYFMQVYAWFAYNSSVTQVMQQFKVILKDRCRKAVITPTQFNPQTIYYQINTPAITVAIPEWTYDTEPKSQCGPFFYTLTVNPFPQIVSIQVDPNTGQQNIMIGSNQNSDNMIGNSLILSATHNTVMTGTLYKPGTSNTDVFMSATMIINYRLISIASSNIIPPPIMKNGEYIIKDPAYYFTLDPFTIVDTGGLVGTFELKQVNNMTIDLSVFTFFSPISNPPVIIINSTDNLKIGDYYFFIRSRFNVDIPYYIDSLPFRVRILHQCVRNFITGKDILDLQYNVSLPAVSIQVDNFKMTDQSCLPITYKTTLQNRSPLPTYITFNPKTLLIKILSNSYQAIGSYQILLSGTTEYYNASSDNMKFFEIKIGCVTRQVKPKAATDSYTYQLGSPGLWNYQFDPMDLWPFCGTPDQVINYEAKLLSGQPLPSGINFLPLTRTLTFSDDESIQVGILQILITGQALDSAAKNTILLAVKVLESNALFLDASTFEKLPLIILPVKPGSVQTFKSDDFKNITSSPYQILKSDPKGMKFVQVKSETASVNPTIKDIGSHIIRLFGISQDGTKYMQEVLIKVAEFDIYKEVTAKIIKITQGSTVQIQFNQPMIIPAIISLFNNQSMWLKVTNNKNPNRENLIKLKWQTASFTGTDLYLNINFTKPFLVSVPDTDDLIIEFLDRDLFLSKTGVLISSRYTIKGRIPKQMDLSKASKYADSLGILLQNGIDAFNKNSVLSNIFFGIIMTRLWGMIASMQVIVLMPLLSVDTPANIQLVYQFITGNMNFQIIPFDLQKIGIFQFNDTDQTPYSPYFSENGYTSLYLLENSNEIFMNLLCILLITGLFSFLDLLMLYLKRQICFYQLLLRPITAIKFLKSFFVYGFLISFILENSLQFMIFSVINILQVKETKTSSELISYATSAILIAVIISLAAFAAIKVWRNSRQQNLHIRENNSKVAAFYELLKTNDKCSLMFYPIFVMRRAAIAMIVIFLKTSKMAQVFGMMMTSVAYTGYILTIKPFEANSLNYIEVFNEQIIMLCLYHMLIFTQGLTDDEHFIYLVGWSMDIILLTQFLINVLFMGYNFFHKIKQAVRRFKLKQSRKAKNHMELAQRSFREYTSQKNNTMTIAQLLQQRRNIDKQKDYSDNLPVNLSSPKITKVGNLPTSTFGKQHDQFEQTAYQGATAEMGSTVMWTQLQKVINRNTDYQNNQRNKGPTLFEDYQKMKAMRIKKQNHLKTNNDQQFEVGI